MAKRHCSGITHCKIKSYLQKLRQKGSILVEFAIGVPLLLSCAAAMHDLPKYERMKFNMEFCAHCAVNMFQNVSMNRGNKAVTLQDFKYISCAAFLPYFGGGGKQYGSPPSMGYFGEMVLCYVKGVGVNKARIMWGCVNNYAGVPTNRAALTASSGAQPWSWVNIIKGRLKTDYDSSYIYKDLKINNGEVKMIADICLWTNGQPKKPSFWGLYLLNPKGETSQGYFHSVVIFTPKPGLFRETPPN